jgi:phytoene synthase
MLTVARSVRPPAFEPDWRDPVTVAADLAACRALLRDGSRTFLAASKLLPRAVRDPACALYAFCRLADDAVDLDNSQGDAVARLRERLARVYLGEPLPQPADRALAGVVRRFAIPREVPEALIDGFAWDAEGRRFETLEELEAYAARVAATVGVMMALLMGVRSREGLARACDLGVAMQLSNIARDVGEDARMGRIYLPRQWLREAGIDPEAWLAAPVFDAALASVVQRLLDAAEALYARVGVGIAQLPRDCRPGINAARRLYAEIGHEVARRGLDSVSQRAVVTPGRKLRVLIAALAERPRATVPGPAAPPLEATRFLVEAATDGSQPPRATPALWDVTGRTVWVIDLLEQLEQRRQLRDPAS